ncbi:hypothetical protein [Methanogenium cariaci]|uniref:hypothetical protein n=1 Tax=Methanogenium cariaci TaxID=2197 RepID=UPI001C4913DC|nr:hypothetical protein [Methanogenium cariaci]
MVRMTTNQPNASDENGGVRDTLSLLFSGDSVVELRALGDGGGCTAATSPTMI